MSQAAIQKPRNLILIHVLLMAAMVSGAVVAYESLPDRYPVHFNLQGEPDRWTDKGSPEFWLLPGIGVLLGVGMLVLLRYPQAMNHPHKEKVKSWPWEKRVPVYEKLLEFLMLIAVLTDVVFLAIIWGIAEGANGAPGFSLYVGIIGPTVGITGGTIYYLMKLNSLIKQIERQTITSSGPQ